MKFMAKYENAVYVVEPKDTIFFAGGRKNIVRGVKAVFGGRTHIFDSDAAAKRYKWDEKTQRDVEEYLIRHEDFGREIYLAPGETVPDHLQEVMKEAAPLNDQMFMRCSKITLEGDIFDQCKNMAVLGKDFCEDHLPSGVVKGILTTTS